MKLLALGIVLALQFTVFHPPARSQENSAAQQKPEPLHLSVGGVHLTAASIQRYDPPEPRPSVYASVVHANGNVEITRHFSENRRGKVCKKLVQVTLRADEADIYGETGEIEARGNVHVSFGNGK